MESMVYANIFKKLTIYDLQGLCKNVTEIKDADDLNASTGLLTVSHNLLCLMQLSRLLITLLKFPSHSSCYSLGSDGCLLK